MFSAYGVLTAGAGWCPDPSAQTGMECKISDIVFYGLRRLKYCMSRIGSRDIRLIIIKLAKFA
jgi:hypothetical protein